MGKKKNQAKFDEVLLEAVDEAFTLLGEKVKVAIYTYLERNFQIPRKQIPSRVDDFSDALEKIFGIASKHLEILIMKKLHERVQCRYKWKGPNWLVPNLTFRDYVEMLRVYCNGEGKTGEMEDWINGEEKQYIKK